MIPFRVVVMGIGLNVPFDHFKTLIMHEIAAPKICKIGRFQPFFLIKFNAPKQKTLEIVRCQSVSYKKSLNHDSFRNLSPKFSTSEIFSICIGKLR